MQCCVVGQDIRDFLRAPWQPFKLSWSIHPATQHNIPDNFNLQQHHSDNLNSHKF